MQTIQIPSTDTVSIGSRVTFPRIGGGTHTGHIVFIGAMPGKVVPVRVDCGYREPIGTMSDCLRLAPVAIDAADRAAEARAETAA